MNGTIPWVDEDGEDQPFQLRVNRARFTLDVMLLPESGSVDWETLSVSCDQALGAPDGGILVATEAFGLKVIEEAGGGA